MRWFAALWIYRLLLPWVFLAAFPGWLVRMMRRGGFGTRLGERAAIYSGAAEAGPRGAVHVHAVSVGEALLALKLVREWLLREPRRRFVIATGTATGHAVLRSAGIPELRVTYAPLDFRFMVRRYLERFAPQRIVLIEGEVWPNLLIECRRRSIPAALVNARMSPRSERRHRRFAAWLRPLFRMLECVAIQETDAAAVWTALGVPPERIHHTGSLKFDPGAGMQPVWNPDFARMLAAFGENRRVVLAASTHAGEEVMIANAVRTAAPDALPVIVPRHAERRHMVCGDLAAAGFDVVLRTEFGRRPAPAARPQVFVIDSTGELRDWTAHADVVIIGKSFLAHGGQNPCEAVLARKPVVCGPHMENFQPLADQLAAAQGCIRAINAGSLPHAITRALDPRVARATSEAAWRVLERHHGATQRIISLLLHSGSARN